METLDDDKTQRNRNKHTEAQMQCYSWRLLLALTRRCRRTDTQIRRGMTTLRQAMDDYLVALGPLFSDLAEWLQIWAKPLCKSTLKPTRQPQPPFPSSLSTSSNHSSLANNALHNQHQAQRETKEVRHHREQETQAYWNIKCSFPLIYIRSNAC